MIQQNVSLKDFSNYKIGGQAAYFLEVNSLEELKAGLTEWQKIASNHEKIFILGGGTNLLIDDNGFDGLVIHNKIDFTRRESNQVSYGAGLSFKELLDYCVEESLSGLEWAGGLPGTVGGAVFGNAGAFGGETKDKLVEVESFDLATLQTVKRNKSECQFDYRSSIFKTEKANQEMIVSATFSLTQGDQEEIAKSIQEKIQYRQDRQPLELPSAGSTFKGVPLEQVPAVWQEKFKDKIKDDPFPVIPAAVFLADANLVGKTVGGAQVSTKHPNFLVNVNNATSRDVHELISFIISEISKKYQVNLEPEVIELKN